MTGQQNPDFETLIDQLNSASQDFREQANENRRERINGEPTQGQSTYGDQPERQFNPEVYLLVPHQNIAPGMATFTQSTFTLAKGAVGSVTLELTNTTVATVVFGGRAPDYWEVAVTVVDGNGDGTVTIDVDASKAGRSQYDGTEVFSAGSAGDSIRSVVRRHIPDNRLDEDNYDLSVSVRGTETDVAVLEKVRSTSSGSNNNTSGSSGGGTQRQAEPRKRPLPRRPTADPPLRSSGVVAKRNGGRTEYIEPGTDYTVDVTVQNAGGVAAPSANVELFVEHRTPEATIDASGPLYANRGEFPFTGFTSLPPGSKLAAVVYDDPGGTLTADSILWRSERGHAQVDSIGDTVDENRTFRFAPYLGQTTASSFRVRVYWTDGIDLTKDKYYPDTTQAKRNYVQVLKNRAVELVDKQGQFVSGTPTNPKLALDLESSVDGDSTLVTGGRAQELVSASGETTVSFDYTAPTIRQDRVLTVFHARAYSLAPEDSPADWGELDHTRSRFIGRTELNWRGISAD